MVVPFKRCLVSHQLISLVSFLPDRWDRKGSRSGNVSVLHSALNTPVLLIHSTLFHCWVSCHSIIHKRTAVPGFPWHSCISRLSFLCLCCFPESLYQSEMSRFLGGSVFSCWEVAFYILSRQEIHLDVVFILFLHIRISHLQGLQSRTGHKNEVVMCNKQLASSLFCHPVGLSGAVCISFGSIICRSWNRRHKSVYDTLQNIDNLIVILEQMERL